MISETRGNTAWIQLAVVAAARFINLYKAVSQEFIEDGVHANGNGKGQIQIADAVWKGLQRR